MASRGQLSEEMDKYQKKDELSYQKLIKSEIFFSPILFPYWIRAAWNLNAICIRYSHPFMHKTGLGFTPYKSQTFPIGKESHLEPRQEDGMN